MMPNAKLIALLLRLSTALLTCSPHRRRRTMIWVSRCLREAVSHMVADQAREKESQMYEVSPESTVYVTLESGETKKLGDLLQQSGIPSLIVMKPVIQSSDIDEMYDLRTAHEDRSIDGQPPIIHGHPIGTPRCQPHAQTELNECAGTCGMVIWTIPLPAGAKAMCPACLDAYYAGNVTPEDNAS